MPLTITLDEARIKEGKTPLFYVSEVKGKKVARHISGPFNSSQRAEEALSETLSRTAKARTKTIGTVTNKQIEV